MSAPEERLTELEIRLAHQERAIEELSGELARQGQALDRTERTLRQLAERFLALEEAAAPAPEATRPPHY
ncbi:SlyX family protein [Aureimonas sp. AU4]|uniref:SlyX family protein n=1 Tax=Aureimonas sp. AU4 TaxID=1638163 RepID=UPI000780BC2B|nr:SlyX family protein [Aureimonas sp. AU4]